MPQTLLLADDSVTIRRVIELTFADENMRVVSVSSGRDAIAKIEAGPPDIVLADAGMPDVSGYDIAAFVKSRPALRHIPVILLAGAFEPLDEPRARKAGSDGVLVKPFEPQMVVARVRELLSQQAAARAAVPARPAITSINAIADPTAPPPRRDPRHAPPLDVPAAAAAAATDPLFDASLDRLDAAFSSGGQMSSLDATAESDFANDLRELRSSKPETGGMSFDRQDFGDWDLPVRPAEPAVHFDALSAREPETAADVFIAPEPEPVVPPMPPPIALAPKPIPMPHPPAAPPPPAAHAPLPLADAFSSLLAAEEGRPHAPIRGAVAGAMAGSAPLTDADMDLIVDRVIARLGGGVRGAVIDLAERLVKAEIDRLKAIR